MAAGAGICCVTAYRDPGRMDLGIRRAVREHEIDGILSFGIAGALEPTLVTGDVVVGSEVREEDGTVWRTDPGWTRALSERLPNARTAAIIGAGRVIAGAAEKSAVRMRTGAIAVDMESHHAARIAAALAIPFAVLRVVADGVEADLPRSALVGLRRDGSTAPLAVLASLARRPQELPALLHLARVTSRALASLAHCRELLGGDLGCPPRVLG